MKVEVLEINENEDGTHEIVFDYDEEYLEFMKQQLGKEELTDEEISQFLAAALSEGMRMMQEEEGE